MTPETRNPRSANSEGRNKPPSRDSSPPPYTTDSTDASPWLGIEFVAAFEGGEP